MSKFLIVIRKMTKVKMSRAYGYKAHYTTYLNMIKFHSLELIKIKKILIIYLNIIKFKEKIKNIKNFTFQFCLAVCRYFCLMLYLYNISFY